VATIGELDLDAHDRTILLNLLEAHLPGIEAWAYGSRVLGRARRYSDLDLVVFAAPHQKEAVAALREALEASNITIMVDLHIWDELPLEYQRRIAEQKVVLVHA
jgi:predicted nucleotidyltransferase